MQTTTNSRHYYARFVSRLDRALERLSERLSKSSRVAGMGAFYYPDSKSWRLDLWRDAGGWTLRLGRTELNLDVRSR